MQNTARIHPEMAAALAGGKPVVALESTLISHGLPAPLNRETALAAEAAVRDEGVVPATIAVLDGVLRVGLTEDEIDRLATESGILKASLRDLAGLIADGGSGATTVAATLFCAQAAGIRVFATGGIGGVHRGAAKSFDISADLDALARYPIAVVCSGAKAILDIGATLEVLETRGVPVIGYGTDDVPGFWTQDSGFAAGLRADSADGVARIAEAHWQLGLGTGLLVANPPPADVALPREEVERAVALALADAEKAGVRGKEVTPYLLNRVAEITEGRSLAANTALIVANARVGAQIAGALDRTGKHGGENR